MSNHKKVEDENTGIHMDRIIGMVPCKTHTAEIGQACWNLVSAKGLLKAICDKRARSAGANGQITPYKNPAATRFKKKEYTR